MKGLGLVGNQDQLTTSREDQIPGIGLLPPERKPSESQKRR